MYYVVCMYVCKGEEQQPSPIVGQEYVQGPSYNMYARRVETLRPRRHRDPAAAATTDGTENQELERLENHTGAHTTARKTSKFPSKKTVSAKSLHTYILPSRACRRGLGDAGGASEHNRMYRSKTP